MRSVVVFSVFSALALGAATAAIADGAPVSITPAPAARDGWSGLYIGLGGGASRVDHSGSNDTHVWKKKESCSKYDYYHGQCGWELEDYWEHTFKNPFGEENWEGFGTIQVGYDRLIHGHLLIGAFADVDLYGGGGDSHKDYFVKDSFELSHTWNVGGRLGFLVTPKVLLYGVGGYTQAGIEKSVAFKYGPTFDDFDNPKGWFAGGGGEVKLRKGVAVKFEYRYADYGSISDGASWKSHPYDYSYCYHCDVYRKTFGADWKADDDLTVQSVRALLVFRLDEPDAPAPLK
ncbi:MAG: outer membrane beta-barrel protein [Hyphomicrobium sp.]|jgi:opacity protein-like surface antigen